MENGSTNNTIGAANSSGIGPAYGGNLISANAFDGILGIGSSTSGNIVQGNEIGTDISGTVALPNQAGIVLNGGNDTTIGGSSSGSGNLISGNTGAGVVVNGPTGVLIDGNLIGTNAAGTATLGNRGHGIELLSPNNTVGGATTGSGNVISGNLKIGLALWSNNEVVEGNLIGTDVTGTIALGNGQDGINLSEIFDDTIGGAVAGAGNLIAANGGYGIYADTTDGLIAQGNLIGTNSEGAAGLGNMSGGILLSSAQDDTIGGTASVAGNVISGNQGEGIDIYGASELAVQGNLIGTDPSETKALGNSDNGVRFVYGGVNDTIGGTIAGASNIIAFNASNGVSVELNVVSPNIDTAILGNAIFSNGDLGISVDTTAPQAAPIVTSAITNGLQTTITGTVTGAANSTFRVELFSNPAGTTRGRLTSATSMWRLMGAVPGRSASSRRRQ